MADIAAFMEKVELEVRATSIYLYSADLTTASYISMAQVRESRN